MAQSLATSQRFCANFNICRESARTIRTSQYVQHCQKKGPPLRYPMKLLHKDSCDSRF